MLFSYNVSDLKDWGKIFQDIEVFEPLVEYIFKEHEIPYSGMNTCTSGLNAVFRIGKYIVKIFAPEETGIGGENYYVTEPFSLLRADRLDISAPKLFADGIIYDKYIFRYLIMEYMEGNSLADMSDKIIGNNS